MAEETYYLIDFENVGLKGLEGAEKLGAHDHVHLFSTRNAPKINTATLANFNATNLLVHEVPAKSQSLDMHLVSYLGYLLGSCKPIPKLVILSNDTDYDDIAQFWKTELGVVVKRRGRFQADEPKPAPLKALPAKASPVRAGVKTAGEEKPAAEEKPPAEKKAPPEKKAPAEKKTPAEKKAPVEKKAPTEKKAVTPEDKTAVNNAVMKALSGAKIDNEIAGFVASQVAKLFAEKNGRQLIYRSIISKYGQEHGLEIYRTIRKLI